MNTADPNGAQVEEPKGTVSFSLRLTEKQRDLLARAAEKRGWSLSSLLKNAGLEKAVHILNTSAPNKIDFRGTAEEIARQVFTPRSGRTIDHEDDNMPVPADVCESLEKAYIPNTSITQSKYHPGISLPISSRTFAMRRYTVALNSSS